jgi:hypothetical protein
LIVVAGVTLTEMAFAKKINSAITPLYPIVTAVATTPRHVAEEPV